MSQQDTTDRSGHSHGESCEQVVGRVHEFLDSELDEASCDEIRHHLDACEACLEEFDAEAAMKQLVHRCCAGKSAPDSVKQNLLASLAQLRDQR